MIAKALFVAETLHRMECNSLRDHESCAGEYPGGYLSEGGRLFRTPHASPARHCRTVINHSPGKTLLYQFLIHNQREDGYVEICGVIGGCGDAACTFA
jgi:hypothetical protein